LKFITTSWDDGAPSDTRLAELLGKYNLQGTFYIPRENAEHAIMKPIEVVSLSDHFEIGGHTLSHRSLRGSTESQIEYEVNGSYHWLYEMLNHSPESFCLPYGHYSKKAIDIIYKSGYKYIRTTELLSPFHIPDISHTTLQVYQHSKLTYFKHLVKRGRLRNLGLWIQSGCSDDHFRLLDHYLEYISINGGCFHLWGHSWEIEELNLWNRLELIFKHISNHNDFKYVQNRELIAQA
jgi:peptidoglycan/xylan/chitin deacetylase (PgdA/CDA1 family)